MGSIEGSEKFVHESFQKWFSEIQDTLFQDLPPDNEEDDDLSQKKKIERVKKIYISHFNDLDILLEFAEDARSGSSFVSKYNPLEYFAVLGGLAFLNSYAGQNEKAKCNLANAEEYVKKFGDKTENAVGMIHVMEGLKSFCSQKLEGRKENFARCKEVTQKAKSAVFWIKFYFLQGFPETLIEQKHKLLMQIQQQLDTYFTEWNLNYYQFKRSNRLAASENKEEDAKTPFADLNEEREIIEAAITSSPKNPRCILESCQYLTDFVSSKGPPSDLEFAGIKFDKHSDIVAFIRDNSEQIAISYPSFLRANFKFAEIFTSELPITRQDREYAITLLHKAINLNPTSSKINHKMGLFLIKSRQFSEARNFIEKAIKLDETNDQAYYSLAKLLLRETIGNREFLENFFIHDFEEMINKLGTESELSFWKGCYFFKTADSDRGIAQWIETILEFYVTKPEIDLEALLPFKKLPSTARFFMWTRSNLTLANIKTAIKDASSQEKTKRRVVFHRLDDIVNEAM